MPSTSSEPKKFDAVTVLGLAVAIALFLMSWQHQSKKAAEAKAQVEQAQRDEEDAQLQRLARERARLAQQGDVKPAQPGQPGQPAADAPKKAVETPDISVTGKFVELVFSSRGAVLKRARLPGVDEEAGKKDHKGLDILAEIMRGKLAFGIPKFDIGPRNGTHVLLDGKAAETLDESIWTPKDSGSFDSNGLRTIAYEFALQNYTLTKTFTVYQNEHFVRCDLKVENRSEQDVEFYYWINGPQGILLDGPAEDPKGGAGSRVTVQGHMAARDAASQGQSNAEPEVLQVGPEAAKAESDEGRSVSRAENLWGSVKNRFFMAAFVSLEPRQLVKIVASFIQNNDTPNDKRYSEPNMAVMGIRSLFPTLNKSTAKADSYALYLGPADDTYLDAAEAAMKPLMAAPSDYHLKMSIQFFDTFNWRWPRVDWLARQMMWVFEGIHRLFGNFGIAVVLMTVLIKMCLHPLQRKMMISMSKMQKLQPELNKIKEKYKNATSSEAKMKMTMEQQDVMKKAGVNPAAGCLPMFIQVPVFSALYGIFNHAFNMRGAEFLWIKDLSQPDRLFTIPALHGVSTWIPSQINLLPILYIVLSVVQTRMQPQTKSDDPQQEMNRKMMMFMPVFISFMFYSMPAGLVLYFAVSACWGMLESWYIKKFLIKGPGGPTPPGTVKPVPQLAR